MWGRGGGSSTITYIENKMKKEKKDQKKEKKMKIN